MKVLELLTRIAAATTDDGTPAPTTVKNPFEGVTPSLTVFGIQFEGRVQIILGGIWALVLVGSAAAMLLGLGKWAWNTRVTHSPEGTMEAAGQFKGAAIAFGCVAGISLIAAAIIWVTQG